MVQTRRPGVGCRGTDWGYSVFLGENSPRQAVGHTAFPSDLHCQLWSQWRYLVCFWNTGIAISM